MLRQHHLGKIVSTKRSACLRHIVLYPYLFLIFVIDVSFFEHTVTFTCLYIWYWFYCMHVNFLSRLSTELGTMYIQRPFSATEGPPFLGDGFAIFHCQFLSSCSRQLKTFISMFIVFHTQPAIKCNVIFSKKWQRISYKIKKNARNTAIFMPKCRCIRNSCTTKRNYCGWILVGRHLPDSDL